MLIENALLLKMLMMRAFSKSDLLLIVDGG
jgi:hypothetical protein